MSWFHLKARAKRWVCKTKGHEWVETPYLTTPFQCSRCRTFKPSRIVEGWVQMMEERAAEASLLTDKRMVLDIGTVVRDVPDE